MKKISRLMTVLKDDRCDRVRMRCRNGLTAEERVKRSLDRCPLRVLDHVKCASLSVLNHVKILGYVKHLRNPSACCCGVTSTSRCALQSPCTSITVRYSMHLSWHASHIIRRQVSGLEKDIKASEEAGLDVERQMDQLEWEIAATWMPNQAQVEVSILPNSLFLCISFWA